MKTGTVVNHEKCGDDTKCGEASGDDVGGASTVMTAPSVTVCTEEKATDDIESMKYVSLSVSSDQKDIEAKKCIIIDGVCCNGCTIKNIKISVKKRVQNKKKLLWSDRSRKITKPICVRGSSDPANLVNTGDRASEMSGSEDPRP